MSRGDESPETMEALEDAYREFCNTWLAGDPRDIDEYCEGFPAFKDELRIRIEEFIGTVQNLESNFRDMKAKLSNASRSAGARPEALDGKTLGDFEILREIGRGGMGVVYEARQISLDRIVALKVLAAHLTLRSETVERFKREAATAAKLDHPGIVEIHAIGEEAGNHFFAMELVKGAPLDTVIEGLSGDEVYPKDGRSIGAAIRRAMRRKGDSEKGDGMAVIGDRGLPDFWNRSYIEAVCRICVQVTEALEHAHGAGVIHRDIKPSNILVREDGSCVLTDFGLAREEGLPSLTVTGELAGTPHYIAPEQASPRANGLNHQVDIYSLGVSLYEMLTQIRPFEGRNSQEILGNITNKTPPSPRNANPLIPKDLETICMTAMEKEPARRYGRSMDFGNDLANFLAFRPIKAQPLGLSTRTYRLIRRNPAYSTVFGLLFLIVVIGPLVFGIQQKMASLKIEEALALSEKERAEKEAALVRAEKEALTANQVSDYLVEIFSGANPFASQGKTITAHELLQQGAAKIDNELADQPLIQARLRHALGEAYQSLGYYEDAETHLLQAIDTFRTALGDQHAKTLHCMVALADLYLVQFRLAERENLLAEALDNAVETHAEDSDLVLTIKHHIGESHEMAKRYEEAEATFLEVIDGFRRLPGDQEAKTLDSMHRLADLYDQMDRREESEALYIECHDRSLQAFGPESWDTVSLKYNLGVFYLKDYQLAEAEKYLVPAFEWIQRTLGDDHFYTYGAMNLVATLNERLDRPEEAESYYRKSHDGLRKTVGHHHPTTQAAANMLAGFYIDEGRHGEAESVLVEAFEKWKNPISGSEMIPTENMRSLEGLNSPLNEAGMLLPDSRHGAGKRLQGDFNEWIERSIEHLDYLYWRQKRYGEAAALAREVIPLTRMGTPEYFRSKLMLWRALGMTERTMPLESAREEDPEASSNDPHRFFSVHHPVRLVTEVDQDFARRVLGESEKTYTQLKEMVKIEPAFDEQPLVLYVCESLDGYNGFGDAIGNAVSSNYPVFSVRDSIMGGSFSVTYQTGKEDPQRRFTLGLVRHATSEQYLERLETGDAIPAWFTKGQAAKFERYFHPEYIRWSVREALNPKGGLLKLDQIFETFGYDEHAIHTAGFICAYLDSEDVSQSVKTAFEHTLAAIRENANIAEAFLTLEQALIDDQENISVFMDTH